MTTVAGSVRELADAVGRSNSAVQRWVKDPRWDQSPTPPFDVAKARAWARGTLQPNPATISAAVDGPETGLEVLRRHPLQAARLKLTLTRASKLELERAILAGELVPLKDVQTGWVRRVYALKAAFQALPRQLADQLMGKNSNEIERIVADAVDGVLLIMSQASALPATDTDGTPLT